MTILAWILLGVFSTAIAVIAFFILKGEKPKTKVFGSIITLLIIAAIFFGLWWYFHSTEIGHRKLVDQQSNLHGIEREINIYTAHGDLLASYEGKIDIEDADGGYVKFDLDGKRYIYYNCLVETIAEIEQENPTEKIEKEE